MPKFKLDREQDIEVQAVFDGTKLPPKCSDCGEKYSDPPSKLCPGCQAYRDHTGQI